MSLPLNGRVEEGSQSLGEDNADPSCDNADTVSTLGSMGNENLAIAVPTTNLGAAISHTGNKARPLPGSPQFSGDQLYGNCERDVRDAHAQAGCVGLLNVGNTCFMNSGLQCLLSNSSVVKYFLEDFIIDESNLHTLTGKFALVLHKYWSGLFSRLHPLDFRNAVGACHSQFQDFRQHDCQEFLAVLLDTLHEHLNAGRRQTKRNPSDVHGSGEGALAGEDGSTAMDFLADRESSDFSESDFESSLSSDETCRPSCPPSPSNVSLTGGDDSPKESTTLDRLHGSSEDSCLSEPSRASTDSGVSDQSCVLQWTPNPENAKAEQGADEQLAVETCKDVSMSESERISGKGDEIKDTGNDVEIEASTNADLSERKLPSFEDFCNKDTKTLNTNVLAKDYLHENVSTDSTKYHKADDNNSRLSSATQDEETNVCDQLNDLLTCDAEKDPCKPVKDTNSLANCHEKFSDGSGSTFGKKLLFSEREPNDECGISNAKRIKIDDDEENLRVQSKLKVNTEENQAKDCEMKSVGHVNEDASHSSPSISEDPVQRSTNSTGMSCLNNEDNPSMKSVSHADRAWLRYSRENKSIIVDTFQGQFKSTMVCLECHHVSVTFEPFMYLSVPLPNAFNRQISVIFIPCYGQQPCCYLVVVNKFDRVSTIRQKLVRMIGENPCDIILAEVFDNHVSRILDNSLLVKFVNVSGRQIYAFEMLPARRCDELSMDTSSVDNSDEVVPPKKLVSSTSDDDKMTSAHVSFSADISNSENPGADQETRSSRSSAMEVDACSDVESLAGNLLNNSCEVTSANPDSKVTSKPGVSWQNNLLRPSSGPENRPGDLSVADARKSRPDTALRGSANGARPAPLGAGDTAGFGFRAPKHREDEAASGGSADTFFSCDDAVINHWKTCAICLEEMVDTDLLSHPSCKGVLCHACLEMSYRHYFRRPSFICPVCGYDIGTPSSFVRLSIMADSKPRTRILSIPLMYRNDHETDEVGGEVGRLFGHPHILYLPSSLTGAFLYEMVDQMVFFGVNYSVILTDGQGYRCSRCLYTQHCSGCEAKRDQWLTLRPSDHLVVRFTDLEESCIVAAGQFVNHESMKNFRTSHVLTLYDCFRAFMESEVLDENNPWFCPRCCRNQSANKTMTVWRYPPTLVVYLKRFVYRQLTSVKIDCKVEFPVDDLDLSSFTSGPQHETLQYSLQSCVCHFGGANSGHYTAYAKHPVTNEWHYFNDETAVKTEPQGSDCSAYILFYERKGSRMQLHLPQHQRCEDITTDSALTISTPQQCIIEEVNEPIEEEQKGSTKEHEFYS